MVGSGNIFKTFKGIVALVSIAPSHGGRHGLIAEGRCMQEGAKQCPRSLRPVVARPVANGPAAGGSLHGRSGPEGLIPAPGGSQGRPPHSLDAGRDLDLLGRIENQHRSALVSGPRSRAKEVIFCRCRHDAVRSTQNIRNDDRCGLSTSCWSDDKRASFRSGPSPLI